MWSHWNGFLVVLSCVLSELGSLAIMLSYVLFGEMRKKRGRLLLMFLSLTDFLSACTYMWAGVTDLKDGSVSCHIQALLGIYFPVASFLWTDCIGLFLYRHMNGKRDMSFVPFHLVCWGLPAVICGVVAAFGRDGYYAGTSLTGGWCWIKQKQGDGSLLPWIILGGKGVEWSSIVLVAIFYFMVWYKNRNQLARAKERQSLLRSDRSSRNGMVISRSTEMAGMTQATTDSRINEFTRKLVLVPVVFAAARLFGNINVVRTVTVPHPTALPWLGLLQAFGDPSQGFFNGVIFVLFSGDVRELFWKWGAEKVSHAPLPCRVGLRRIGWALACGGRCGPCRSSPPKRKLSVRNTYSSGGGSGHDSSLQTWDFS